VSDLEIKLQDEKYLQKSEKEDILGQLTTFKNDFNKFIIESQ